jgi:hypothetical protein
MKSNMKISSGMKEHREKADGIYQSANLRNEKCQVQQKMKGMALKQQTILVREVV